MPRDQEYWIRSFLLRSLHASSIYQEFLAMAGLCTCQTMLQLLHMVTHLANMHCIL